MEDLTRNLKYGLRMLVKNPVFTIIAVMTLALGIGANTAIFSVVNGILLRPLPYADPDRLVGVWETNQPLGFNQFVASLPNFVDWKEHADVFDDMAAYAVSSFNFTSEDEPERIQGAAVSANLFSLLGVSALQGRTFLPEEGKPGAGRLALLSHGLWQRRFGSDPGIVGKEAMFNGINRTVVGVMPPTFEFPIQSDRVEVWVPLQFDNSSLSNRGSHNFFVVARLKSGATIEQARSQMTGLAFNLQEQYPDTNKDWGVKINPLHEQVVGDTRLALTVLLAAVGLVLLIACANVTNLLLVRAAGRAKEIAIRAALGATRVRIMTQLLTESLLLGTLGGLAGLAMAYGGLRLLVVYGPSSIPRIRDVSIDARVLIFTFMIALLTGVLFGVAPAFKSARMDLNDSLKDGGKGSSASPTRQRTRSGLVIAEIALALVLLISAGLMIKSFSRLQQVDPGFDVTNLLTFDISLPPAKYRVAQQRLFYQQLLQQLEGLPGVRSVTAVAGLPLKSDLGNFGIKIEGRQFSSGTPSPTYSAVAPGYFSAMGIPLERGREFTERDMENSPLVVTINETMARSLWPNEDPLGKRITIADMAGDPWREIVGVVKNIKHLGLEHESPPEMYVPYLQRSWASMSIVVRTMGDPKNLINPIRSEVRKLDKDMPLYDINTMEQLISELVAWPRFRTFLLGIFATVSLVLSSIGIYGVMSYSVLQRTHEIGLRMALGAQKSDMLKLIVGQGMVLTLIGVAVGLATAFAVTRVLSSLLFQISFTDAMTYAFSALLLAVIALLASFFPARKAMKVDPMIALRYE